MKYSEKILQKDFSDQVSKRAYLDACKWLAVNVVPKEDEFGECHYNIKKISDGGNKLPTFRLTLYATLDELEAHERNCKVCREVHRLFYVNDANCNSCNAGAYRGRMLERIKVKSEYIKEIIRKKGLQ